MTSPTLPAAETGRPALHDDPLRPRYHFLPPANWMNDPNGPLWWNGYYHLFYQYNPYGDAWGYIHWGHARSRDLVHWEHLPLALAPSYELGEQHCFSGCAAVDDQGQAVLIYTSVGFARDGARLPNQQWAAIGGDPDLVTWQKLPDEPALALPTHGGPPVGGDWRDPFIFTEGGRTFLVLAANTVDTGVEQRATVLLYEATDGTLLHWRYCDILYSRPLDGTRFLECPNFVKVDGKWVLLVSPYRCIEYIVGDFDLATLRFTPECEGILDPGEGETPNFYASNILMAPEGYPILLGWARGFSEGRGWNGALALPRLLSLGPDGRPRQAPWPGLAVLRGPVRDLPPQSLPADGLIVPGVFGAGLEIELAVHGAGPFALRLLEAADATPLVEVQYTGETVAVQDTVVPFALAADEPLRVHLFLDQSLLQVFAADGRVTVTRILDRTASALWIELQGPAGAAIDRLSVWPMSPAA